MPARDAQACPHASMFDALLQMSWGWLSTRGLDMTTLGMTFGPWRSGSVKTRPQSVLPTVLDPKQP
jgi:hypothetical protein